MPLHKKAFYLLLLFLPSQLSIHAWPPWSYVIGRRIDYLSPTIYLTDILILLILITDFKKLKKNSQFAIRKFSIILIFVLLNIIFSSLPYLTTYKWLKILEFIFLGVYIIKNINIKKDWENIVKILSIGIIFESLLAIFQFLNQSSINGIFFWFGERNFSISTPNIAKAVLNDILILRPYATFPHPNALAGYLAVILPLILITDFKPIKIKWLAFVLGLTALLLTFSRPAIFVGILAIITAWLFEHKKNFLYILLIFPIILIFLINLIPLEPESVDRRINLNTAALEMFKKTPIFGVGLGNFIPSLPLFSQDKEVIRFLQPAHNIYLLSLAETGLFGLTLFLFIISISFKKLLTRKNLIKILILNSLFLILILGLLDHYFLTLQQPQLLFTIILSLSLVKYPHEV